MTVVSGGPLVSAQWLAAHLGDSRLRVIDIRSVVDGGARAYVLAEPDKAYAVYLAPDDEKAAPREAVVSLEVPEGNYRAEWVNPLTGKVDKRETVKSKKGLIVLTAPPYREDMALKLIKK